MNNPFDDTTGTFRVLVNDLQQHSLWPSFADVPAGWVLVFGPASREDCLEFVEENWTDITPRRLTEIAS
ncbi:MbtH family protein [Brevibacterium sediminis]|uniref:MbtH family protein n=1 Tax=Brevibacterium sediminis TaxID=1857024 RepID=UPI002174E881|nr:MbtH family protein [Brevibacterium sediminis]MCS4594919.1 MbtH family protein [Brevibacterium sediminis]